MDWKKLGQRIREERIKQRLTQEQLAEQAGINESYVGQIKRGAKKPSLESLIKIANVLGVTIDYLLQDNVQVKRSGLIDELVAEISKRDNDEARVILIMSRLIAELIDRRKS